MICGEWKLQCGLRMKNGGGKLGPGLGRQGLIKEGLQRGVTLQLKGKALNHVNQVGGGAGESRQEDRGSCAYKDVFYELSTLYTPLLQCSELSYEVIPVIIPFFR